MSDPAEAVETDRTDKPREGFELDRAVVDAVEEAIERDDHDEVRALLEPVHDADVADLLQNLSSDERRTVVEALRRDFPPDVLAELDERVRDEVIEELGIAETVNAVRELETDDAVHIISELEEDQQELVLKAIPPQDRTLIEEALAYPDYSAGRLMRRELVAAPVFWTVGDTIDHLRATAEADPDALPDEFFDIFVVDPGHRPVGSVSLSRMLRARRAQPMTGIMTTDLKVIDATADQEDVAFLFRQRDLTSAPVVDAGGRLVGVITIDDVVDVIDEEHEDDIMRLGGVREDDLYSASVETAQSRFAWLLVNLGTAILASAVIGLFDATIEHMVALAVLMPIVASMGGNAGTQTLTVAVRALATKELTEANALRVVGKEVLVGAMNGFLFAVITGIIAWLWFSNSGLGLVIGLAMIVNLIVAGLFGALIPLALDRIKIDPAIASAVFLTTVTDVVGFFAFLGLGAWLLM
ncbi:MAG TPA: magnesium transporter [Rhodospirillales bacterium]|nr:magnesium transporter [Rhodospirillales bacterium]